MYIPCLASPGLPPGLQPGSRDGAGVVTRDHRVEGLGPEESQRLHLRHARVVAEYSRHAHSPHLRQLRRAQLPRVTRQVIKISVTFL